MTRNKVKITRTFNLFLFLQVGFNKDGKINAIDYLVYGNGGHSTDQSPYVSLIFI